MRWGNKYSEKKVQNGIKKIGKWAKNVIDQTTNSYKIWQKMFIKRCEILQKKA